MRFELGWFDERKNTPSVLVGTMATQTDKVLMIFGNLNEFIKLLLLFVIIIIGTFVIEPWFGIPVTLFLPILIGL